MGTEKPVRTLVNAAYHTAERSFRALTEEGQTNLRAGANTAVSIIAPLEPMLLHGEGPLSLKIASDADAIGVHGDVRDVLCVRSEEHDWEIGMSCKHNHAALRHPRVTEGKDFGSDWIGVPCSEEFMREVTPVTNSLISLGEDKVRWRTVDDKMDRYYVPILSAYLEEIRRMCAENYTVPEKLLSYFFGANDFYKVIVRPMERTTTVQAFHMHGTLGKSCGPIRPMTHIPVLKMPTKLVGSYFKDGSKTTIILVFDGGWSISMRLHNKDDIARPTSLAWDVQLAGWPPSTYVNTHAWYGM